ncbi:Helicase associated domain protein [Kitasatospora sp. NPDC093679]|uniref:DEAD/DEAH box helicase n=1 Tax=Kitasatospora sp. NPDC093679 TaxID=3154983 RepID=UPI00342E9120
MPVKLRPHQEELVEVVVRGFDVPPGGTVPADGLRVTAISPCGSGKTVSAAHVALQVAPRGRVLVLVPTLDLLTQTVEEWLRVGHEGPAVAVCSLQGDGALFAAGVRCTTNPLQLALWHGDGPVTIYATYASLEVLEVAFLGAYGARLEPMNLTVVDEAHRTSGSLGKAWAAVHDQGRIPSERRLYMTATPRIWQERSAGWEPREGAVDRLPVELAASMDDETIFGKVAYKLSMAEAVSRGILARYQIIVVEVPDPYLTRERLYGPERNEEEARGLRLAATQAAMLRAAAEHHLQTMITFHRRTVEAEAFAAGLPAVAAQLHADDPSLYPEEVWVDWLHGEHGAAHRRSVLREFGQQTRLALLANCRVLGEGVDVRAVDSVAFLDPKGSPVEIVQAIGRALRQRPGDDKLASLVVMCFTQPGESEEDMLTSASYRPLVRVLQGLRSHDEEAVEMLATPTTNSAKQWPVRIGAAPGEGEEENRLLVRFSSKRDPYFLANLVSFNVINVERADWNRGYLAAQAFRKREKHLRVPYDHREGSYPLGRWVSEQRRAHAAGVMEGGRYGRLEALGMVWDAVEGAFQENLAAARVWFAEHGTLAAPRGAVALGKPVGQWLSNCRRPGAMAGRPHRAQALAEIDPDWNPDWSVDWQRHWAAVAACLDGGARVEDLLPGVTVDGDDIGRWVERQRRPAVWRSLRPGQRERLERLGIEPHPSPAPRGAAKGSAAAVGGGVAAEDFRGAAVGRGRAAGGGSAAFRRGVAALRQYAEREARVVVPRGHVEVLEDGVQVRLGVWLSNAKSRRDRLDREQLAQLAGLGLSWAVVGS